jgi:hypothetical protein
VEFVLARFARTLFALDHAKEMNMRHYLKVLPLVVVVACQPARGGANETGRADSPGSAASPGDTTAAQSAASSEVMLSVDKPDYAPGGTVVMTITSHRTDTLGYNPCSNRSFERGSGGRWVVHPEPNRMCTMELRLLNPHETQTANAEVPGDASAGTYRLVLRLRPERADTTQTSTVMAVSAPFTVTPR